MGSTDSTAHASLYCSAGASAQTLSTTPAVLAALATAGPTSGNSNGGNQSVLANTATNNFSVGQGRYRVSVSLSGIAASAAAALFKIRKNGVAWASGVAKAIQVASGGLTMAIECIVDVVASDLTSGYATLDVAGLVPSGTLSYTLQYGSMTVERLAD